MRQERCSAWLKSSCNSGSNWLIFQRESTAGVFNDARLALAQAVVALGCRKPAPDGGSEQVARDLFACKVLQVVGLQLGFGFLQPRLEGVQLLGADAPCADANRSSLARSVAGVRRQFPLGGAAQLVQGTMFQKSLKKTPI